MEIDNDFTEKEVEGEETREWKKRSSRGHQTKWFISH
jgi:hypothetical protein